MNMSHTYTILISAFVVFAVTTGLLWGHGHPPHEHATHTSTHLDTPLTIDEDSAHEHNHTDTPAADELSAGELTDAVRAAIAEGRYQCCLAEACTSCFVRHQNENEELLCDCLEDIVTGNAPCRACVDGILAGDGNQYLAEYFAKSLSERVGTDRYPELVALVTEHYGISAEQQY